MGDLVVKHTVGLVERNESLTLGDTWNLDLQNEVHLSYKKFHSYKACVHLWL